MKLLKKISDTLFVNPIEKIRAPLAAIISNSSTNDKNKQRGKSSSTAPQVAGATDEACAVETCFFIVEVDEAEPFVGDLFRRRFNTSYFPEEPRHFVALATMPDKTKLTLGYVHYAMWRGCALCGGLVIDERHFRRLPTPLRRELHDRGGIAELLLRETFKRLPPDIAAIWGYVGDRQSEKVCLRVGFKRTQSKYLMVIWKNPDLSENEKEKWIKRATEIGPF